MAKLEVLPKRLDVLDANDEGCQFRVNIDILNECLGLKRSLFCKAVYPDRRDLVILDKVTKRKVVVWMPKLYGNSSLWKNVLSKDWSTISEVADEGRHEDWITEENMDDLDTLRIVFVKPSPKAPYRFVGVFQSGEMNYCNHTYERIATKVKLIGDPVVAVELLDY